MHTNDPNFTDRHGAERIYFFSQLAIEMNEPEEEVAPTDSRRRPDQRLMEDGKWDEANRLKFMLEEKQRAARRQREAEAEKLKSQGEGVTWAHVLSISVSVWGQLL